MSDPHEWATVYLADGPQAGHRVRMTDRLRPDILCTRVGTGPWQHYAYASGEEYRFQGYCADLGHVIAPSEFCDRIEVDAEGGEHSCGEFGRHAVHRCCCGFGWEEVQLHGPARVVPEF